MFEFPNADASLAQPGQAQPKVYAFEGALAERLRQDGKLDSIEWASFSRSGRISYFRENATVVDRPSERELLIERVLTDITEAQKLRDEIRRTRRGESTGDPAAAAIQSLQDLCTSLVYCSDLLKQAPDNPDTIRKVADDIANDANRGIKHARQFLQLSKKQDRTASPISLNQVLTDNSVLMRSLVGDDIELQTTLPRKDLFVSADRQEIIQLISNLIASSREALPLGGSIGVEIYPLDLDAAEKGYPTTLQAGIYVCMKISSDGCGVQPERRTGSIRTLLERMGGHLESSHTPHSGNIHRIYLPRIEVLNDGTEPNTA